MRFGALGDIHGDFESVRRTMRRHPDIPFWICVGDVADDQGRYEPVESPLYWIKGNNEGFDAIATGQFPANLHYLPQARAVELDGVVVAGLGGTFAPTWYNTPAAMLPGKKSGGKAPRAAGAPAPRASRGEAPRSSAPGDDKRRHFVREEVEACKALRGVDVWMTHEAPRPFWVGGGNGRRGNDAGKTPINEVLAAMQPRLHLFGHHHRFAEAVRQGVRSVGLDLASRSYLLLDGVTLHYDVVQVPG